VESASGVTTSLNDQFKYLVRDGRRLTNANSRRLWKLQLSLLWRHLRKRMTRPLGAFRRLQVSRTYKK